MSATTSIPIPRHAGRTRPGRAGRLLRGPQADPRWARPALLGLLALTALLYLWDLGRNGWANDFYAAAVQAGTKSWKAFFFGSFDQSSFITVDKTPGSLWVMELSGRIFGFSQWSMLAPQALEGVGSVLLLYAAVKRWFGPAAGLIAGLVLALTPAAALMFRFNNPDALLVLLMTAAAYTLVRAVENGRTRWLVFTGLLIGFAFLAKMMQAFLVVPGFAAAYLWAGPPRLGKRIWQTLLMGAGIVAGAGWWILAAQLTPAADRPYFGGSTTNSILQLAIGYNGLGRLTGDETGSVGPGAGNGQGGGGQGASFGGATGIFRLFHAEFGGQISWLLPAALISLAAMAWVSRRAARTDRTRAAALLWGGWVLVTGLVFSYMNGIIHPYYMVALAPGIAALVGIGAMALWQPRPRPQRGRGRSRGPDPGRWPGGSRPPPASWPAPCGRTSCSTGRRTGCRGCAGWYWSRAWPPRAWCWPARRWPASRRCRGRGARGWRWRQRRSAWPWWPGWPGQRRTRWTPWAPPIPARSRAPGRPRPASAAVRAAVPAARAASPVPGSPAAAWPGPERPAGPERQRDRGTRRDRSARRDRSIERKRGAGRNRYGRDAAGRCRRLRRREWAGRRRPGWQHHGEQRPDQAARTGRIQLHVGSRHRGLSGRGAARAGYR